MDDRLLEPLTAYKECYEREFLQNAARKFEELLHASSVDEAQNRASASAYRSETEKSADAEKANKRYSDFVVFCGCVTACCGIAAVILLIFIFLVDEYRGLWIGSCVVSVALCVAGIVFIVKFLVPREKASGQKTKEHAARAEELMQECLSQIAPLEALYDDVILPDLIRATVPQIELSVSVGAARSQYIREHFGAVYRDPERMYAGTLSGELLGNPFVLGRKLCHFMGTRTYSESIVITWQTSYIDSEGHIRTEYHSEVLTGYVTKPCPYYFGETSLEFYSETAPDLSFSRKPSHAERLNEGAVERKVKKGSKKIRRMQEKSAGFTELGNAEFDVLFGALDRDHEVQFRLLFTPLAQKNLLALMRGKEGFGDDFSMIKRGAVTTVVSEHSSAWDPDCGRYLAGLSAYSVELARKNFITQALGYFRNLYFDLAPILSIPLYQQTRPSAPPAPCTRAVSEEEAECAAYRLGGPLRPPAAETDCIFKTCLVETVGKTDVVRVNARGYHTEERVEIVTKFGGDGNLHSIAVPWTEYFPVEQVSTVVVRELGLSLLGFGKAIREGLGSALEKIGAAEMSYGDGILCCLFGDGETFDRTVTEYFEKTGGK